MVPNAPWMWPTWASSRTADCTVSFETWIVMAASWPVRRGGEPFTRLKRSDAPCARLEWTGCSDRGARRSLRKGLRRTYWGRLSYRNSWDARDRASVRAGRRGMRRRCPAWERETRPPRVRNNNQNGVWELFHGSPPILKFYPGPDGERGGGL